MLADRSHVPYCPARRDSAECGRVTRQLKCAQMALESLKEYHRVEMWSLVHLHYMSEGPERRLIEFKLAHLRQYADQVFSLVRAGDTPTPLMELDVQPLAAPAAALSKFACSLREEIEFMNAFEYVTPRGRLVPAAPSFTHGCPVSLPPLLPPL